MQQKLITVIFLIVGLINFVPIVGAISGAKITQLYAVPIASNDLELLLRHRAVLLGIVGAFLLVAAFVPQLQGAGFAVGFASMSSFIVLIKLSGPVNSQLSKVAAIDWGAIILLFVALLFWIHNKTWA